MWLSLLGLVKFQHKWNGNRLGVGRGAQIRNYWISVHFNVTVYAKQRQTIQSLVGSSVAQVTL